MHLSVFTTFPQILVCPPIFLTSLHQAQDRDGHGRRLRIEASRPYPLRWFRLLYFTASL